MLTADIASRVSANACCTVFSYTASACFWRALAASTPAAIRPALKIGAVRLAAKFQVCAGPLNRSVSAVLALPMPADRLMLGK
ncbi:hypothetical protein D3C86_2176270 [compost metagenome]